MRSVLGKAAFALVMVMNVSAHAESEAAESMSAEVAAPKAESRFSLNVDPIYIFVSGIGGRADYFINDKYALEIGGIYVPNHRKEKSASDKDESKSNWNNYNWEYSEVSLGANVMLTGNLKSNGVYIAPGVGYANTRISEFSQYNLSGSSSGSFVKLTAGYQWVADTNFRVAVGGGIKAHQANDIVIKDSNGKELSRQSAGFAGLALDAVVGYLF